VVLALLLIEPASLSAWSFSQQALQVASLALVAPSAQWIEIQQSADLNGDGKSECLILNSERLQITNCQGKVFWQSPAGWQVKEAQVGDLNRDGKPEVDLLVWRLFKPWPIDQYLPSGGRISAFHNRAGLSCHVILIGWVRGGYNELWAGSALIQPVSQLRAVDLDGDGWQELAALEGQYDRMEQGGYLTIWKWNGFGFTLADQVKQNYSQLQIMGTDKQKWLFVQK
jgi:hypothetical protein